MSTTIVEREFCQKLRLPRDCVVVGVVVDRRHSGVLPDVIRETRNGDMQKLLRMFMRSVNRSFNFSHVVVAGPPGHVGAIGGLAREPDGALRLFRIAKGRFDDMADRGGSFTSAWLLFVDDDMREQIQSLISQTQQIGGTA